MNYKNISLLSYSLDPSELKSLIPNGLELDLYDNKAIVTINIFKTCESKIKGSRFCFKTNQSQFRLLVSVKSGNERGFFCITSYSNSLIDSTTPNLISKPKNKKKKIDLILKNKLFSLVERSFLRKKYQTILSWKIKEKTIEKTHFFEFLNDRKYFFIKKNKHTLKSKFHLNTFKPYKMLIVSCKLPIIEDCEKFILKEAIYVKRLSITLDAFKPFIAPILFFDGKCGFCNAVLRLILKLDKKRIIKIAPNDGLTAQSSIDLLRAQDRIILLDDLGISEGALAFLRILDYLPWIKILFYPLKLLPLSILNYCYDKVAKHRSKCNLKIKTIEDERLLP
jgi:predicted DCC family thiol-disulfide oxidoreductase YuxK